MYPNIFNLIIYAFSLILGVFILIYFWIPLLIMLIFIVGIAMLVDFLYHVFTGKSLFSKHIKIVRFQEYRSPQSQNSQSLDDEPEVIETHLDNKK